MMQFLAFDFGATSGRAIAGSFDGNTLSLAEKHRFSNEPVFAGGTLYWDVLRLYRDLKEGLCAAAREGATPHSLGIDTWGVDVAFLDRAGRLLANPLHYRDSLTDGILEKTFAKHPKEELYAQTGTQFMQFNTLFQLLALQNRQDPLLDCAAHMLFIPDLLNYFLTGQRATEPTIASTSQLLALQSMQWNEALTAALALPAHLLPPIRKTASVLAPLLPSVAEETGIQPMPVVLTASHDTAAAVASVPAGGTEDTLYISSGTWSLVGVEKAGPVITPAAFAANVTNEVGAAGNIRLLKNVMGLWICNECCRQWEREGGVTDFAALDASTAAAEGLTAFINPDDLSFLKPGNMPEKIARYCRQTQQPVPSGKGAMLRVVNESLAMRYRTVIGQLEELSGKTYSEIHVVGGGCKNALLCQYTANALGRPVVAGPVEATACGNILSQMLALGAIGSLREGRQIIRQSFPPKIYYPAHTEAWTEAYEARYSPLERTER